MNGNIFRNVPKINQKTGMKAMETKKVVKGMVTAVVFKLPVRIEGEVGTRIRKELAHFVEAGERFFVYDLSNVHYIDSAGLGAMVSKIATIRSNGGDIVIIHPTDFIRELLQVTNLNQVFKECDNLDCAFDYFRKKQDAVSHAS